MVWHDDLLATMRKYACANMILCYCLYDKAQCAVMFNGITGDWFKHQLQSDIGVFANQPSFTISCVRCKLTRKVVSALETVYYQLPFADGIVINAEAEEEADILV